MGKLKRLEIENKVLRDKIRVAQYLLMDETEKDYRKTPYIFGYLCVLDVSAERKKDMYGGSYTIEEVE